MNPKVNDSIRHRRLDGEATPWLRVTRVSEDGTQVQVNDRSVWHAVEHMEINP